MELEDPKSLESPTTPTTEDFIHAQLQQRLQFSSDDNSDDNQSVVTVRANHTEEMLILNPTDDEDFVNANVFVKFTPSVIDGRPPSNLQTIVEVVNPMLSGDGTATEIAIGRTNDDASLPSFDIGGEADADDDEHDGVVLRRELSLNDKMKNVLKELKENEKVRLSLSRSMDEEEDSEEEPSEGTEGSATYEEKTGSIGTKFMVRERLINDFYDHPDSSGADNQENVDAVDNSEATVFANPSVVDAFLASEIHHATVTAEVESLKEKLTTLKETLTLDLNQATNEEANGDDDDDGATPDTPLTPTASSEANINGGKKKRKKNKNKKK